MQAFTITNNGPAVMRVTAPGSPPIVIPIGGTADVSTDNVALVKIEDAALPSPQGGGGPGEPSD